MPTDRQVPDFASFPLLWLAAALASGILAAKLFEVSIWFSIPAAILFGVIAAAIRDKGVATILILAAFILAGAALLGIERSSITPDRVRSLYDSGVVVSGDPVDIEGVVYTNEPTVDGEVLTLRTERLRYRGGRSNVSGNVRLYLAQVIAPTGLRYGSRIRAACELEREDQFLDPGVVPKREILDRLGIDATCSLKSPLLIEHIADESVFLPLAWVYDQRAKMIEAFRNNLSPRAAGVMIASLLGDKNFLDKDTSNIFRDGGTFHILVISGLHITFIGGLLYLILRWVTRRRWMQFVVTNTVLWGYTLAVGADVPVVRAAVMFTVVSYSFVIHRRQNLLNSLGLCTLILLVWRPSELFDPSLQLTFVSVAAIIALAYPLIEHLRRIGSWTPTPAAPFPPNIPLWMRRACETIYWNKDAWQIEGKRQNWSVRLFKSPFLAGKLTGIGQRSLRFVFEGILVSAIVQISMLPLTIVYFHRVSVASVLLNLWVGFFIAIESFCAVAGVLAMNISVYAANAIFFLAEISDRIMLWLPGLFSDYGWASFRLPAYSGAGGAVYFAYFIPLIVLAIFIARWRPFDLGGRSGIKMMPAVAVGVTLLLLSLGIVFHPFSSPRADGRLHIDFLDVGQGDSALITFPDGSTMLVDGGGRPEYKTTEIDGERFVRDSRSIGDAVVSEFLWNRGYSRIDQILATHADADHVQGLADVAANFQIGSALFGRTPPDDADLAQLLAVVERRGIPVETVFSGIRFSVGGVDVSVLYPPASADPNALSNNDNSVVVRLKYGGRSLLLTGDIERNAESALLADGGILAADVIKIPHHGSRTSSTQGFIEAVKAEYAIISVGRSSPFGHPHPDVVDRWKAAGAKVMTTGERGMISVSTDGRDLQIGTFVP